MWEDEVLPEPDIRNISVAAGRDAMHGPAVLLTNIKGYPGKQVVVGVHGSFTNLALLLGRPKGTSVKELFYEMVNRWGSDEPLIEWVSPEAAPVLTNRVEANINLYELLPLYRINEYDGGFYIDKANVVSRDPSDPEDISASRTWGSTVSRYMVPTCSAWMPCRPTTWGNTSVLPKEKMPNST